MFDLRNWLRRAPKPKKLRIKTADDEERTIELTGGRTRWNAAEETLRASGAVSVECLDAQGNTIRATRLKDIADDDDDEERSDPYAAHDKSIAKAMAAQAQMLREYQVGMNQAFDRGAAAAGQAQDKLVELVEVLTHHMTVAITNLHNVSVNLSNLQVAAASGADDANPNGMAIMQLLAGIMGKLPAAPPEAPSKPNGAKKP